MRKSKGQTLKELLESFPGVQKSSIYELYNKYYTMDPPSRSIRQTYLGFCTRLVNNMVDNGATAEELERALLFSYVVLDSEKHKLSIITAKDDFGIQELHDKYK